jgi:hypothetical protein
MDLDPDKDALFNEASDMEHVPNLLEVPGVRAAIRIKGEYLDHVARRRAAVASAP